MYPKKLLKVKRQQPEEKETVVMGVSRLEVRLASPEWNSSQSRATTSLIRFLQTIRKYPNLRLCSHLWINDNST